ncbi:MAG: hypothetical protein KUG78_04070 [Kangiellaceae bacterium]|nr:hypothetical protein [Kangiellaceae bacterium]
MILKTLILILLTIPNFLLAQGSNGSTEFVTYKDLISALDEFARNKLETSPVLKSEFLDLQKSHGVSDSEEIFHDYVRVRLAFEATRDSGLWQIRWTITDKEPNSDSIWNQWDNPKTLKFKSESEAKFTAEAECDELSALFAFISKGLGVDNVGLFWPTWNHTVGVWTTEDNNGRPIRIVVPTSQIFLSTTATLGTNEFDPYMQKHIYQYDRNDIDKNHKIPKALAEMMLMQVRKYGAKPSSFLQARRNKLSERFGGS